MLCFKFLLHFTSTRSFQIVYSNFKGKILNCSFILALYNLIYLPIRLTFGPSSRGDKRSYKWVLLNVPLVKKFAWEKSLKQSNCNMDFKLELQTQSIKNHCAIIFFLCEILNKLHSWVHTLQKHRRQDFIMPWGNLLSVGYTMFLLVIIWRLSWKPSVKL